MTIPKWVDCNRCWALLCWQCAVKVPDSPYINFSEKKDCDFAKNNCCTALACYSNEKCSARDDDGNPKYI